MQRRTARWAHLDSNQGPTGYEPAALTAELWAHTADRHVAGAVADVTAGPPGLCRRGPQLPGAPLRHDTSGPRFGPPTAAGGRRRTRGIAAAAGAGSTASGVRAPSDGPRAPRPLNLMSATTSDPLTPSASSGQALSLSLDGEGAWRVRRSLHLGKAPASAAVAQRRATRDSTRRCSTARCPKRSCGRLAGCQGALKPGPGSPVESRNSSAR